MSAARPDRPAARRVPGAVSVTAIRFRHWWQAGLARRRYRSMARRLAARGYELDTACAVQWAARRVLLVTSAGSEEDLRRAASEREHIAAVRWAIPRRVELWSGVFALQGWSSMSGPPAGVWSDRAALREAGGPAGAAGRAAPR